MGKRCWISCLLYTSHKQILQTIIELEDADEFIIALSQLIKRLAVDHLHIVGDIFDRGGSADKILDRCV